MTHKDCIEHCDDNQIDIDLCFDKMKFKNVEKKLLGKKPIRVKIINWPFHYIPKLYLEETIDRNRSEILFSIFGSKPIEDTVKIDDNRIEFFFNELKNHTGCLLSEGFVVVNDGPSFSLNIFYEDDTNFEFSFDDLPDWVDNLYNMFKMERDGFEKMAMKKLDSQFNAD